MDITHIAGGKLRVESHYHPDFVPKAKALGGRYTGDAWVFDARDETRVRSLLVDVYGTDGSECEMVTVRMPIQNRYSRNEEWCCGRMVARRRYRDRAVELGDGVVVVSGGFPYRGGSVKSPDLDAKPDTIVEIRDVPLAIALREQEAGRVTILGEPEVDRDALEAERAVLLARLAEIDALLGHAAA